MKKGTIVFNRDLTTIGEEAFKDCENLVSITIPKKVNSILANAFSNCINLTNIEYNGTKDDFAKIKLDSNIKHPNTQWPYGNDGIPNGWEVVDAEI